jgi:hypothetical protein
MVLLVASPLLGESPESPVWWRVLALLVLTPAVPEMSVLARGSVSIPALVGGSLA